MTSRARSSFDYDASGIPAVYDRARSHTREVLDLWMRTVEPPRTGKRGIETILDLGCGTGRFSAALARHFDAQVLGVDPSAGMLAQTRAKPRHPRVRYALAPGEALPLADASVDLVFMSMIYHHVASPAGVAEECRRVLRPGATAFLRTATTDRIEAYAYMPFFPSSAPLLREILPSRAQVRATFEEAGLRMAEASALVQRIASTHAEYADKLEAGGDSVLARLDRGEFEHGLSELRGHASRADPKPVTEPIDYFRFIPLEESSESMGGASRGAPLGRR